MTKEEKENLFKFRQHRLRTFLRTPENKEFQLTDEQVDEIIENALYVLTTGVDFTINIWAIQWENDYVVKTIKL